MHESSEIAGGHPAPLVVAGAGGSGSRVFARILVYGGRYMGEKLNPQQDAIEFAPFLFRWGPRYIVAAANGYEFSERESRQMSNQFAVARDRHRAPMSDPTGPWGLKHPLAAHVLPFLHGVYPQLRFIHVIRDGRDFAFRTAGGAHAHTARLGPALLDGDPTARNYGQPGWDSARTGDNWSDTSPARKALFWARLNSECADYGEQQLGERYLRVRLEDLCAQPDSAVREVFAFAEAGGADPDGIRGMIETPSSVGSWREQEPAELDAVLEAAAPELERFGYGGDQSAASSSARSSSAPGAP